MCCKFRSRKRPLSTNYYAFQQFFNIMPKFLLIEGLIFMGEDLENGQTFSDCQNQNFQIGGKKKKSGFLFAILLQYNENFQQLLISMSVVLKKSVHFNDNKFSHKLEKFFKTQVPPPPHLSKGRFHFISFNFTHVESNTCFNFHHFQKF